MLSRLMLGFACLFMATIVNAVELKDEAPTQYVVKKGDTLWDISGVFLEAPWEWPRLWGYNAHIENPHLIYPGDIINITYVDGKPRATLTRGGTRDIKLSPAIKREAIDNAIPPIELRDVIAFLTRTRLATEEELEQQPKVFSTETDSLMGGIGDNIYGRGDFPEDQGKFQIYRDEGPLYDPVTEEVQGNMLRYVGAVDVDSIGNADGSTEEVSEDQIAKTELIEGKREIMIGDYFFEDITSRYNSSFVPSAPEQEVEAVISHVFDGVTQVGRFSIVAINKGRQDGLTEGNTLAVFEPSHEFTIEESGDTVVIPEDRQGLMMIFKTWENASFALIMKSRKPLRVGYIARNP